MKPFYNYLIKKVYSLNKFKIPPWKSQCPQCNVFDNVYIFDKGFKFFYRLFIGDSRFACRECDITWRRRNPHLHLEFKRAQKDSKEKH